MTQLGLARLQFGVTTIYHFLFVPLTIGLSFLIAIMETQYYRTRKVEYRQLAQYWGQLFLINFAIGVVTGILQEFQFGLDWADYSRFVGDIFGAPLAVEALMAFFLESAFIGIWVFGWDRVSRGVHLAAIWMVALGTSLSAFWILTANPFMQEPVGYVIVHHRAEMASFGAILTNPQLWVEFPHAVMASWVTASVF
ncbi:MAG: cytochrome ubiquinol oxidase subunit I, partial [Firmicutes bacterium]|nr:cytochrome ubiquinol oxidase subunit I [Bacillota bacterium]